MPAKIVRDILAADAMVTGLVSARIEYVYSSSLTAAPYVTLAVLTAEPTNHLRGDGDLDLGRVIVTAWAQTYEAANTIAEACRTALQTAGHFCESRDTDQFSPDPDPGLFHVEQQFLIWK